MEMYVSANVVVPIMVKVDEVDVEDAILKVEKMFERGELMDRILNSLYAHDAIIEAEVEDENFQVDRI